MRRMADPKNVVTKISKSDDGILINKLDGTSYEVEIQTGVTPTGNINITTTNQVDVTNYATAQVVDANLTASNIKNGVEILGITGNYNGDNTDYLALSLNDTITSYTSGNVTKLRDYSFYYSSTLRSISCPVATRIGNYCFYYCTSLENISFPAVTYISEAAFRNCTLLKNISFPAVRTIVARSFMDCTSLESANFQEAISIGGNAFMNCTALTSMTLGASSVCNLSSTGGIPASSSQHLTIYVPSDLIASYQAATNWSTLYNNGYITFAAIE